MGLVQEAVLGAAKPGLGMGTQVPQVVVTVGLHEVLEGLGDPAGEGSSQLKPQLLPGLYPVHPLLPQPRVLAPSPSSPSPSCTHSLEPLPVLSGPSQQRLHRPLRCPASGSGNYSPGPAVGLRVPASTSCWHSRWDQGQPGWTRTPEPFLLPFPPRSLSLSLLVAQGQPLASPLTIGLYLFIGPLSTCPPLISVHPLCPWPLLSPLCLPLVCSLRRSPCLSGPLSSSWCLLHCLTLPPAPFSCNSHAV